MDAYAADSDMYAYERSQLPMVKYARWALLALAVVEVLTALMMGAGLLGAAFMEDRPDEELFGMVFTGVCLPLMLVVIGVVPAAAAAVGLGRGAKWGWILTIVVGVLNIFPCCTCLPLGAFLLYAMLNDGIRGAFSDA